MENAVLPATRRTHLGSKHTRRIRERGQIPAVVYGHKEAAVPIALDAHEVETLLHHHSRVIKVNLDNKQEQFLIKSVQYDHLDTTPIHLDLMRVDVDERVEVEVEVVLRGTPAGAQDGGVLLQPVNRVLVECVVISIPEEIRHSVVDMKIGDTIHAGDLELPPGVKLLADADETIAICQEPAVAVEAEDEEGEGEAGSEPQVIGRAEGEGDSSDDDSSS